MTDKVRQLATPGSPHEPQIPHFVYKIGTITGTIELCITYQSAIEHHRNQK